MKQRCYALGCERVVTHDVTRAFEKSVDVTYRPVFSCTQHSEGLFRVDLADIVPYVETEWDLL